MMLDGERLSYRTLDVEQIGSVYEAIMGFRVELTTGSDPSPCASPKRRPAPPSSSISTVSLRWTGGKRGKGASGRNGPEAARPGLPRRCFGMQTDA